MKKVISVLLIIFVMFSFVSVLAVDPVNIVDSDTTSDLIAVKENAKSEIDKYVERYGSESYGMAAYILKNISIYSIPVCFLGIAVGAVLQFVMGIRRLDLKQKGSRMMLAFITVLAICQVLPLIFALVVVGWRG